MHPYQHSELVRQHRHSLMADAEHSRLVRQARSTKHRVRRARRWWWPTVPAFRTQHPAVTPAVRTLV